MRKINKLFSKFALGSSKVIGTPTTMVISVILIIIWAMLGPIMHYSDTWQLVINTTTTIITFLLAISIQYTQNRDTKSIHTKLNKLLEKSELLRETLIEIEKELEEG